MLYYSKAVCNHVTEVENMVKHSQDQHILGELILFSLKIIASESWSFSII